MASADRQRRWKRIARLYANGRTQAQIGARLGLDPGRVGAEIAKMRQAGWELPYRQQADPGRAERQRKAVRRMWPTGASYAEMAEELGLTHAALSALIRRMRVDGEDLPYRREPVELAAPVRDRVLELWAAGASLAEIGEDVGQPARAVAQTISRARKLDAKVASRQGTPETAARRDRIADLYRAGKSLAEIAGEVGGSARSVGAIISQLRAAGVDLPPRHRRQGARTGPWEPP